MTPQEGVIFLVSADAALTQQLINELVAAGRHYQLPLAISVAQARKGFRRVAPTVILLDESAVKVRERGESLESAGGGLTEFAPGVVFGAAERQAELALPLFSGADGFVARVGGVLSLAVGVLWGRVRLVLQASRSGEVTG